MKNKKSFSRKSGVQALLVATSCSTAVIQPVLAQNGTEIAYQDTSGSTVIEEIAVVGTRREGRSATQAPVPVDVLNQADLEAQGSTDILDVLTNVVPSYNVGREPISDAGTLVRPANLRGLPSDSTLVLVNGKRRHRGAVIGEFISGINKGAQGVDLAPIPGIAMRQVEVLRDGAAAQYGSDAIAGVINFVLADDPEARKIQVSTGEYSEGDGSIKQISGLFGTHLGTNGFATLAFEAKDTSPTSRGVQDTGAQTLIDAGNEAVPNPVVVWGTPEITEDYKVFFNAAVETGVDGEAYAFGNYATRDTDGSFFYRNPTNRSGVYSNDGGASLLVADLTDDGSGACSSAPADLQQTMDDPDCFVFNELYPGGFTPRFGGKVIDTSFVAGVRGEWSDNLKYDLSASFGQSEIQYEMRNSLNASYGPNTPTNFSLGTQIQSERLLNADFSYPIDIGLASDLNIAFGAQFHDEEFEIIAGQTESWAPGGLEEQGFSIGSNGFQGFSSDVAGRFSRTSQALYIDTEADVTDNWLMSVALRFEDFDDFGSTTDFKIATRLNVTDSFSLRGAYSTGFRAPTVGQSDLRRSATSFENGQLIDTLVVSPTSAVALQKGGQQLEPEESTSFSIGTVLSLGSIDLTIDYFNIEVDDRLSLKEDTITAADISALEAAGVINAASISSVQFFVNDFSSETQGVDLVATWPLESDLGNTDFTLAYNWTETEITAGDEISEARIRELEESLPESRLTLTTLHTSGDWSFMLRGNYYDETFEFVFNDTSVPVTTPSLFVVDAEVGYQVTESISLNVGAKNLFDERPDEWSVPQADESVWTGRTPGFLGAIYPLNSAAGFNGAYYYLRAGINF
ncbi:TonB-dependent receptor [Exilibacterium tricleocarpae]|uniref:TonB-dependent receptor n=1 Tax=Exilibacterium tricleocarpae TaxID=2591008 RepID=A0A545SY86_9GAMM|nr:TonB-dependent receptor [Exilibacterium tricleocarpae]TQV69923.1 TonB-dependent receptor [Exilibacterium tricleocarpae]